MALILEGSGKIRNAAGSDAIVIDQTNNSVTVKRVDDGLSSATPALRSTDIKRYNPSATTGWYWLKLNNTVAQYYIDMDFDGGGWVCVATHPINVSIPVISNSDYRASNTHLGSSGFTRGTSNPHAYATWAGLGVWDYVAAQNCGNREVVYFTSSSQVALGATSSHSRRSRWSWGGWNSNYSWQGANNLVNEVGGTTPGFWSYHIANTYAFLSPDGGGCAANNAGFWYGACWDGNFWGANGNSGYANAAFWTGSGSDYYNFGAVYVR